MTALRLTTGLNVIKCGQSKMGLMLGYALQRLLEVVC